jgi:hypothetical protein
MNDRSVSFPDLELANGTVIVPEFRGAKDTDGWNEFEVGAPVLCFKLPEGIVLKDDFHAALIKYRMALEYAQDIVLEYPEGMSFAIPAGVTAVAQYVMDEFEIGRSFVDYSLACWGQANSWHSNANT